MSENEFRCSLSHFTVFTLNSSPDGKLYSKSSDTPLLLYLVAAFLSALLLAASLTDCIRIKQDSDFFPHFRENRGARFCVVLKYSFLYNFPVLNIWGFLSNSILSSTKALWFSSMIWLILAILLIAAKYEAGTATLFCLAFLLSLLLVPHSLLPYCFSKNTKPKKKKSNPYL